MDGVRRLTSAEAMGRASALSGTVAGADDDGSGGEFVVPDPPVEDERVERLLYVRGGRVQLVEEEQYGSSRAMASGGQNTDLPSRI